VEARGAALAGCKDGFGVGQEHVAYVGEVLQRDATRPGGKAVGGVQLDQTQCRTAEECGKRIVEDYRHETEKMREPLPDPAEELLRGGLSWRRLARSGLGSGWSLGIGWLK